MSIDTKALLDGVRERLHRLAKRNDLPTGLREWLLLCASEAGTAADRLAALEAELVAANQKIADLRAVCNVNGDWTLRVSRLEQDNARLRGLLGAARCPNCDGSGAIPHGPTPDGDWEAEQCQWCYEKQEALAAGGDQ